MSYCNSNIPIMKTTLTTQAIMLILGVIPEQVQGYLVAHSTFLINEVID